MCIRDSINAEYGNEVPVNGVLMLLRGLQRYPLRNTSPERSRNNPKDPTSVNTNKRWQSQLRGTISPHPTSSPSRSRSPPEPSNRQEYTHSRLKEELDDLRHQNATLKAREVCSQDEFQTLKQHCEKLEDARDVERREHEHELQNLRKDKERAEEELAQVMAQRDLLWQSHSTLQAAVERLEGAVHQHQDVITQLRQRNQELEPDDGSTTERSLATIQPGLSSPEMSAVMQQLVQLIQSDPHRVINELCAFPLGAAIRLLQKDVLPLLSIDAEVCDRIQRQLADVHTPNDLADFKEHLLAALPQYN
eukprot:TRINITY_DN22236_c0_g1_i1.p1 TRINITY_DN22236_c0_g1~~TRINITY_DN22236_c0_g1_i1.p1  ORF type:complete len:306 (+),score=79.98 TRINITY_DN22236_c0_g1_i1:1114-2031(+)